MAKQKPAAVPPKQWQAAPMKTSFSNSAPKPKPKGSGGGGKCSSCGR